MTADRIALVAGALLGAALPLLSRRAWRGSVGLGAVHFLSLASFAVAGWLASRDRGVWTGIAVVAAGAVWVGFFWIVPVARALGARARAGPGSVPSPEGAASPEGEPALDPPMRELLARLLSMGERRVGEIATDRDRVVYADLAGGVGEVLEKIRASGHLRIPMGDGSIDRIVGVVHAKDVLPPVAEGRPSPPLKGLMRRALFAPRESSVASLLELFRGQRGHLAIVVDEYGRTVGVVTRSDVFRHLAGGKGGGGTG